MKKTKKQLGKKKKDLIQGILGALVIFILAYGANCAYMRYVYGNRHIETFPYEMLNNLPDEPDWRNENAFYCRFDDTEQAKKLREWICSLGENEGVVSKNGVPMPIKNLIPKYGTAFGVSLYNNNGNLVAIYDDLFCSLKRVEIFSKPIKEGKEICVATVQTIVDSRNSYVDHDNNNTLYYYVEEGMYNSKVLRVDENVEQLDGTLWYNIHTEFPIVRKDGEIYTYILEDSGSFPYDYDYRTEEIIIKKIVLSDLEVECEIEDGKTCKGLSFKSDDESHVLLFLKKDIELQEGVYNLQDIMPKLLEEEAFIIEDDFEQTKIYIEKSLKYDDDKLY